MTPMSQRLKDFAHRLAVKHGIRELKPGESRPENYYIGNRATGRPFVSSVMHVTRLGPGDRYDFLRHCGDEPSYEVTVDGDRPHPLMYSPTNPYRIPAGSRPRQCPHRAGTRI